MDDKHLCELVSDYLCAYGVQCAMRHMDGNAGLLGALSGEFVLLPCSWT
jgi:hypothetical protein